MTDTPDTDLPNSGPAPGIRKNSDAAVYTHAVLGLIFLKYTRPEEA